MDKIRESLETYLTCSVNIEDKEYDNITYEIRPIYRSYPPPSKLTGYAVTLMVGADKYSAPIFIELRDVVQLGEILLFLSGLRTKWEELNSALEKEGK